MADITSGELLARCLAAEGVRFVFGLPCPEVDPLLAALEGNDIRFDSPCVDENVLKSIAAFMMSSKRERTR